MTAMTAVPSPAVVAAVWKPWMEEEAAIANEVGERGRGVVEDECGLWVGQRGQKWILWKGGVEGGVGEMIVD